MKKILSLLLCFGFCCSFASCKDGETKETLEKSDVTVWTAGGTEKILREQDYSGRYGESTLTFGAFRNESESAQIILSAKKDVEEYTIALSDLTSAEGNVLPCADFEVYNQKYIFVNDIKDLNAGAPVGYYPDAILPYNVAVEYGENKVNSGENQGIWIVFRPDAGQNAGVYRGNFTITVGEYSYLVPVSAEVYDYTLSDQTHSKSSFMLNMEEIALGELNSSEEMYVKYYEYLLDHRINSQNLPGNAMEYTKLTGDKLQRFLDYAEKYSKDPRCSSYNIPFNIISATYTGEDDEATSILSVDFELFEDTLRAMAERSVEAGVNLFSKAATYFIFFDEYDLNGTEDTANYNLEKAYKLNKDLSEQLAREGVSSEICDAVANLKHKCVGSLTDKIAVDQAQFVPKINEYHSAEMREKYYAFNESAFGENGELWWYTCETPRNPSPTYHIEDQLISSRLLSWMMYDYGVTGNLYWNAALYAWRESAFGNLILQNYYSTALRYPTANGDGFLLYPGRPYGIDGPVGSIRLQSIADGNEDYDLLYALEEKYARRGVSEADIQSVFSVLYSGLYAGTQVQYKEDLLKSFDNSREALAQMLVAADKAGLIFERFEKNAGKAIISFSAPKDLEISVNGQTIGGTPRGEYTVYTYEAALTESVNNVTVRAGAYSVRLNMGGKNSIIAGDGLKENVRFLWEGGEATAEEIDGESCTTLRFETPAEDDEKLRQMANIDVGKLNINNRTQKITFRIYVTESFRVRFLRDGKGGAFSDIAVYDLSAGWNEIVLTAENLQISSGTLNTLQLEILGKTSASVTVLSIGQIHIEEY